MAPRFLFLESFYGGSHKLFANGLKAHSSYHIDLVTLPAQLWRWRYRTAALHFVREVGDPRGYNGVIVTDLIDISDLKAHWPAGSPPVLLYMHESQITYPLPRGKSLDTNTAFADIRNALAADLVLFNSHSHRNAFLKLARRVSRNIPDESRQWIPRELDQKSAVLYPGLELPPVRPVKRSAGGPPVILWNHRWEYDKNPSLFFRTLRALLRRERVFNVVLVGECPQFFPKEFLRGREMLGDRLLQYGYAATREDYLHWLSQSDIVISTAQQENFGIATVEAIRCGCYPLLPHRLSYPELIPQEWHTPVFYRHDSELLNKLDGLVTQGSWELAGLAESTTRFTWDSLAPRYDEQLLRLSGLQAVHSGKNAI